MQSTYFISYITKFKIFIVFTSFNAVYLCTVEVKLLTEPLARLRDQILCYFYELKSCIIKTKLMANFSTVEARNI